MPASSAKDCDIQGQHHRGELLRNEKATWLLFAQCLQACSVPHRKPDNLRRSKAVRLA
jgi:hypothetical protein